MMELDSKETEVTKMKKLLSIIMMACMIVTLTPIACGGVLVASADDAASANTITVDKIEYAIDTDTRTATIVGSSYGWSSSELRITIPETIESGSIQYVVTAIADNASIGASNLTYVNIPSTITSIGNDVFGEYGKLATIIVDSRNQYYCAVDNVLFDKNQKTLIKCGVGKTREYTIPSTVTTICDYAFYNCTKLTKITIPSSVTSIGNATFRDCKGLTEIEINNSVTSIGDEAFYGCKKLTEMPIPNSVTSIGDRAFRGCTGLTSVDIPNSVTEIGDEAFRGCSGLESIHIPSSVMKIGTGAFCGCTKLTTITVDEGSNSFTVVDNVLFNKDQTSIIFYPATYPKAEGVTSYTIPDTVTRIEDCAFYKNEKLTSVTIPTNLTYIGDCAFYENTGLVKIGDQTFMDDENATGVKIPASVTYLGASAFYGDTSFTSLIFESGIELEKIDRAFDGCKNLEGTITIPASLAEIGYRAFANCEKVTAIMFEANSKLKDIGGAAFSNCNKLTSIEIPASVEGIGGSAFYYCFDLGRVTFDDNSRLTRIGYGAFYQIKKIEIDIPESVKELGASMFRTSNGVTINYGGSKEQWNNIKVQKKDTVQGVYLDEYVNCDEENKLDNEYLNCYPDWGVAINYKQSQDRPTTLLSTTEIGYNKITLTSIGSNATTGASAQYRIADGEWQDSAEFTGLVSGRTYTFEARYKAITVGSGGAEVKYAPSDAITDDFTTLAYVKFDSDGGTTVDEKTRVLETDYVLANVENPTKGGYTFAGWKYGNKSVTATTTYKELVADDNTIEGITLVAQWTPIEYPITYVLNDGGLESGKSNPTTYTIESNDIILCNPTKVGYTFVGWTGTGLSDKTETVTISNGSTGTRTYTANWTECKHTSSIAQPTCTASATCSICRGTIPAKGHSTSEVVAKDPTEDSVGNIAYWHCSVCGGDYTDKTCANSLTQAQIEIPKLNRINITYNLNSGDFAENYTAQASYLSNAKPALPAVGNIKRTGYTFEGWYTDASLATAYDETKAPTSGTLTLYAKWEDKTAPVISGIENGKTYYVGQEFTVTDVELDKVTIDGTVATPVDGKYKLTTTGENIIIATDKTGNEMKLTVTVSQRYSSSSKKSQTITEEQKQAELEKAEAEKKATEVAEAKNTASSMSSLKARSSKTQKGNIKVVAKLSTVEKAKLAELTELGYTVKYKFYRSTKKSSDYKTMLEKTSRTYTNTSGKTGTRYYYKAQVRVYDTDGTLIAKTALKQCKYATRKF